jgi:hypothetical protein
VFLTQEIPKSRKETSQKEKVDYCFNPGCGNRRKENDEDADDWLQCEFCDFWFCETRRCVRMEREHEKVCMHR